MAGSSEDVAGESGNDPDATTDRVENGTPEVSGSGRRGPWPWWGMVLLSVLLVAAIVAVVAVLSMIPGESSDDSDASPSPSPSPSEDVQDCVEFPDESAELSGPVEAPEDAGLEVVETGFYGVADPDGVLTGGYGVVLENPSELVAYDVQVEVEFFQSGEILEDEGDSGDKYSHEIDAILPGESLGFGGTTSFFRDAQEDTEVDIEVEVEAVEWWPENAGVYSFGSVEVSQVEFKPDMMSPVDSVVELELTESSFCDEVRRPMVSAVYRDSNGRIVGGSRMADLLPEFQTIPSEEFHSLPMQLDAQFDFMAIHDELVGLIDPEQVEVYIGPGEFLENED